jgi:hypothetical protein
MDCQETGFPCSNHIPKDLILDSSRMGKCHIRICQRPGCGFCGGNQTSWCKPCTCFWSLVEEERILVFSWLLMSSGWLCASTFLPCRCFDCILSLGLWTSVVKIWKIRWSKLYKFMYSRRFQANMLFPVFLIVSSRSWFILPTISSDRRHRNSGSGNNHAQSRRVYHEHNCQKLSTMETCKYCKYDGYREHTLTYS